MFNPMQDGVKDQTFQYSVYIPDPALLCGFEIKGQ
jgi:hypothetical protein